MSGPVSEPGASNVPLDCYRYAKPALRCRLLCGKQYNAVPGTEIHTVYKMSTSDKNIGGYACLLCRVKICAGRTCET
jgi:hypothetical protein